MNKYLIHEIVSDGYERFAVIKRISDYAQFNVHFIEYSEYLENGEQSKIKKVGDIIQGDFSIELVTKNKIVNQELFYIQRIPQSPNIEAVVEITQIISEDSVYALSSISNENLWIGFEGPVNYTLGDRVFIVGTLEIDINSPSCRGRSGTPCRRAARRRLTSVHACACRRPP